MAVDFVIVLLIEFEVDSRMLHKLSVKLLKIVLFGFDVKNRLEFKFMNTK